VEPITEQEETADGKSSGSADDEISVEINGTKYKAFVLTGEEEIAHWKNVNKVRKQAALNNPKGDHRSGSRRGRGFKRGGKGYQGRNDRSDSKRKPRDGDGSGNKRIKAE